MRRIPAGAATLWRRLLAPPAWVDWFTRRAAKTFTGYCLLACPALLFVADKEKLAAMHLVGSVAGLLWWWAEHRVRAAWKAGHRAGTRDTLTLLAEASVAATGAAVVTESSDEEANL